MPTKSSGQSSRAKATSTKASRAKASPRVASGPSPGASMLGEVLGQVAVTVIPQVVDVLMRQALGSEKETSNSQLEERTKRAEEARDLADRKATQTQTQLEEVMENIKQQVKPVITPTPEAVNKTKATLGYKKGFTHIAVAGIAGSGKSSLVNSFRGYRNNARGINVAPTGATETTSQITPYPDPNPDNSLIWYDIPGAGTLTQPDFVYFNDQGLYIFECIVVLFDARFTDTDIAILKNCRLFNIPSFIVRSKCLQNIRNIMEDLSEESEEEEDDTVKWTRACSLYDQETRRSVAQNLEQAKLPSQRVYLIDKQTMVQVAKGRQPANIIDEGVLWRDLMHEVRSHRAS